MLVSGDPSSRHGIVRQYLRSTPLGVKTAMPTAQALRLCPQALIVAPNFRLYSFYSKQILAILNSFTPWWSSIPSTKLGWTLAAARICSAQRTTLLGKSNRKSSTNWICPALSVLPPANLSQNGIGSGKTGRIGDHYC